MGSHKASRGGPHILVTDTCLQNHGPAVTPLQGTQSHATRVAPLLACRLELSSPCEGRKETHRACGRTSIADNRDGPRRGTRGHDDAPDCGRRSWCAGTLNPEGEC